MSNDTPSEAITALLAYSQADEEGVIVEVSRQAIHEVVDENARLREELAEAKRDREEARDIHNSNMNRYAERAERAEARALAKNDLERLVGAVNECESRALRQPSEAMLASGFAAAQDKGYVLTTNVTAGIFLAMLDQFERDQGSAT